jgi:hypothetical protein
LLPAGVGDRRDVEGRSRGIQIGLALLELLVQFRRFDFRQQIALMNARADVGVPGFQVTAGAGVNGRIGERLCIAGQHDFLGRRAERGVHDGDRWNRRRFGLHGQCRFGAYARSDAAVDNDSDQYRDGRGEYADAFIVFHDS